MVNGNKIAVLSRYKEDNNFWYDTLKKYKYEIIVFNKFEGQNLLPNIGREGHTYFHYIVENYNSLPDEILFSQYDPIDHFKEKTVWKERDINNNINKFLNGFLYDFIGIRPTDFDLIVRHKKINWIDFSKKVFNNFEDKQINKLICCGANLNGVFRVSSKAILRRPLIFYKKCLEILSKDVDPYEGYYFERMWKYIFTNYGCNNNNFINFINNYYLFGTDSFIEKRWRRKSNPLSSNFSGNICSNRVWKNNAYGHLFLHEYGTILSTYMNLSLYGSANEIYWSIEPDNCLRFFDANSAVTSLFNLNNITWPLYGYHYNGMQKYDNFHWLKHKMFM